MKKLNLRKIPSVEQLLNSPAIYHLLKDVPRTIVLYAIRSELSGVRYGYKKNTKSGLPSSENIIAGIIKKATNINSPSLRPVINATGVILHTGLGRSFFNDAIGNIVVETATKYSNLELDLETGERKERNQHIEHLLKILIGAEAGLAVNNNAAAILLALNTIAQGKEVIVSRGHLVEIGGGFRLPDVINKSGAKMKEIGTTNKTYFKDYREAITADSKAILKVHTSNFRMIGFVAEAELSDLVKLTRRKHLVLIDDLGSGALIDFNKHLPDLEWIEPTVQNSIKKGADIVTFSGDKLLGGPQAGIIVGKKRLIEMMKRNPLYRAFRLDKFRLAALEVTLKAYLNKEDTIKQIPMLKMILASMDDITAKAKKLAGLLSEQNIKVAIEDGVSYAGGGSLPSEEMPTKLVTIQPTRNNPSELAKKLRLFTPTLLVRLYRNKVYMDMRTVKDEEVTVIADIFKTITP